MSPKIQHSLRHQVPDRSVDIFPTAQMHPASRKAGAHEGTAGYRHAMLCTGQQKYWFDMIQQSKSVGLVFCIFKLGKRFPSLSIVQKCSNSVWSFLWGKHRQGLPPHLACCFTSPIGIGTDKAKHIETMHRTQHPCLSSLSIRIAQESGLWNRQNDALRAPYSSQCKSDSVQSRKGRTRRCRRICPSHLKASTDRCNMLCMIKVVVISFSQKYIERGGLPSGRKR